MKDWRKKPGINSGQKTSQQIEKNGEKNLELEYSTEYGHLGWIK